MIPDPHPDLVHYGEPVVPYALDMAEVVALLIVALGFDGRHDPADELTQAAWHDTADRAGWTLPEAVDAVREFYAATDNGFVTPGAVTRLIRARRAAVERQRGKAEQLAARARLAVERVEHARPEHVAHREHMVRVWRTLTTSETS